MNYCKAYHLDASEFAQCLCGFESILKNEKIYMVGAKGLLIKRNKKSVNFNCEKEEIK